MEDAFLAEHTPHANKVSMMAGKKQRCVKDEEEGRKEKKQVLVFDTLQTYL
jgi:hypothetical protein